MCDKPHPETKLVYVVVYIPGDWRCVSINTCPHVITQSLFVHIELLFNRFNRRVNSCTTTSLCVFVVAPAAHVAITEAICLWHFTLFLPSPSLIADRFYVRCDPRGVHTHTFTHTGCLNVPSLSSNEMGIPAHRNRRNANGQCAPNHNL